MGLVSLLYPKLCAGCGREGEYLCGACWDGLPRMPAVCPECNRASAEGYAHARCRLPLGMERLVAPYQYKGVLQKVIKETKYKNAWGVAEELAGKWAREVLVEEEDWTGAVVTSVPMYGPKARERGFNQAERLGRALANSLQGDSLKVEYREMLRRVRATRPQYGLSRKERARNVKGAFVLNPKSEILNPKQIRNSKTKIPKLVLLVDDVWTTGSTMRECTRVLRRKGFEEVWGVVLAR